MTLLLLKVKKSRNVKRFKSKQMNATHKFTTNLFAKTAHI